MINISDVKQIKTGFSTYKQLLTSVKPYRLIFFLGIVGTIIGSSIDAGFTWFVKPIIDHGFIARDTAFLKWLPIVIVSVFTVRSGIGFASTYCVSRVGRTIVRDFRQQIFQHLLKLPATFYDQQSSGQLLSRLIFNVEQVAEACTTALLLVLREGVLAIGLVVVMFVISWKLSLLFMVAAPLIIWITKANSQRLRQQSNTAQDAVGEVGHIAEETIEAYQVIRTFGGARYETNKFGKATEHNRQRDLKIIVTNALGTTLVQLILSIAIAGVLFLVTLPSLAITAGSFAALITAMLSLLRPIRRVNQINTTLQKGIAGADSVFELLATPVEIDDGKTLLTAVRGHVQYQSVNFRYASNNTPVLHTISFEIAPGETVALVGRSGSGKSTISKLLQRFYDINSGNILLDGTNIRTVPLANLREQFSLVSQHVTLFNDTIAHNIAYGQLETASETSVLRAAKLAHALEFIEALPKGIHTLIGENGVLLSGGQRQRLAIARAILKDAPLLILDEATASLDTESERAIQSALAHLMKNRSTLVIAHRLSTIENADRILVLDQGRIVESGTHTELLAKKGHYAKLHAMQFANA